MEAQSKHLLLYIEAYVTAAIAQNVAAVMLWPYYQDAEKTLVSFSLHLSFSFPAELFVERIRLRGE